jgi:hypothetical protein
LFGFVKLRFPKPHCFTLHSWYLSKALDVHWFGLRVFGVSMCKFLIIEPFFQWKLNKIETESCIGICGCSWCCWKAGSKSDLMEFISQILELRCGKYWFWSFFFFLLEIQTNCKIWVYKEKSVEPSMCWDDGIF